MNPITYLKSLPQKTRKRLKWGVGLLGFYTLFGFLILPLIIKVVAVKVLSKELKRETTIESVRLNPYAMSLTVRGLQIKDPDAKTLLSWDEVYVNFRLRSVFTRAWGFDHIRVINPYVRVQLNKDLSFNFSDILDAQAASGAEAKPDRPAKPIAVALRHFLVEGARLEFTDLTPKKPFHRLIGPVRVELNDFRTDPHSRNPHVFSGATETGERFTWGGSFSLEPVRAFGQFSVENVQLKELAPLYEDLVQFEIREGVAAFSVNYDFEYNTTTTNVAVSNLTASVHSLRVGLPGSTEDLFELPEASVGGIEGDLLQRRLEVGSISAHGGVLNIYRPANSQFNLVTAATPNMDESAPAGVLMVLHAATNVLSQLLTSTNLATATVRNVLVEDCRVTYRDEACLPPASLTLDQIRLKASNLSNLSKSNMMVGASLRWNTNGSAAIEVAAALDPLAADVGINVQRLDLAPLDPYLRPHLNAYVLGSKVSLEGAVRLRERPDQLPEVTFNGGGALEELNVLGSTSEDLLKWGALRFQGMNASLEPMSVTVSNVVLSNLAARVVIETNRSINVLAVLPEASTNGPGTATETVSAPDSPGGAVRGGAIKEVFAQVKSVLGMNTNLAEGLGLPKVEVASVQVEDSEVQFVDRSVIPEAHASLQKIHAQITDLSTEEMQRAKIHAQTLVGGTGPVELTAELSPLHAQEATHAKVSLKNVQLTPADPYAGKYLGYRLTRGKLNVDVDYTVSASELKGRNVIVIDQLTLGSKVHSPDAISLPVKLGIALLKDSEGKIEIDVPVEGNLDDPKFRLGKVIWGVVANVFVKAVTSPFSLLGGLVGGGAGEDMQYQEFARGSAELNPAATEKLANLAKALEQRPGLQVVVEGNVDPVVDGWALRRAKMEQQLRQARWNSLRASARENVKPEDIVIPSEVRSQLVEEEYRALVETNAAYAFVAVPDAVAQAATNRSSAADSRSGTPMEKGASRLISGNWTPPASTTAAADSANATPSSTTAPSGRPGMEQMENSLTAAQVLADTDYAALARARAEQVQSHLVQNLHVASDRVLIGDSSNGMFGTNGCRVVLQLQ